MNCKTIKNKKMNRQQELFQKLEGKFLSTNFSLSSERLSVMTILGDYEVTSLEKLLSLMTLWRVEKPTANWRIVLLQLSNLLWIELDKIPLPEYPPNRKYEAIKLHESFIEKMKKCSRECGIGYFDKKTHSHSEKDIEIFQQHMFKLQKIKQS